MIHCSTPFIRILVTILPPYIWKKFITHSSLNIPLSLWMYEQDQCVCYFRIISWNALVDWESCFFRGIFAITKREISYVPLNPVSDYVHILDLNTRPRVGWKTLPNLNSKLKFQTQISNSNYKLKLELQKLKSSLSSRVPRILWNWLQR